ncbi:MAG TPA: serine/threonine-protein kinase [Myxococcaceae bacterium]|jgi:tetratricopeptide (TPR) repeat protein/predicted Ser/Thr protein kinase
MTEADATLTAGPAAPRAGELAPGARLGRYVVEARLGGGGAGTVYAARDQELGREVALKILGADSLVQHGRALGEAKALARVSHPNVVAVYEAGIAGGVAFIAMERLHGTTLKAWLAAEPRTWRQVLEACVQAGRGVAAAHAVGLIHRDVKPSNVLVERSGRVAVTDFGLARAVASEPVPDGAGTPAYMAPEQRAGEPLGPWTDQYAFCLVTIQALSGRAPRAVVRCLKRGMSHDPRLRWPSMDALLEALERAAPPRWRSAGRLVAIGVGAAVVVVAGAWFFRVPACGAAEHALDGVWDDAVRGEVHSTFLASGDSSAPAAFDRAGIALDAYRWEYLGASSRACLAERTPSSRAEDRGRSLLCLSHRRRELAALVALLRAADRTLLPKAADAARALRPVSDCEDPAKLRRQPPQPVDPLARQASEAVREQVAAAAALRFAARFDEARTGYERALAAAEATKDSALVADVLLGLAATHAGLGDYRGVVPILERAALEAEGARHDEAAARARVDLLGLAVRLDPTGDLEALKQAARASVQRLGGDAELELLLLHELANLASARADRAEELARYQEAMELTRRSYGPDDPLQVVAANNLGSALGTAGRYQEAVALHQRAMELRVKEHGPDHADVAGSIHNIARVLADAGRLDEALARERDAVSQWRATLGEGHPRLGRGRQILAEILLRMGRAEEALPLAESALVISEATVGRERPEQAPLLSQLGLIQGELGAWGESERFHRRAITIAQGQPEVIGRPLLAAARIAEAESAWLRGRLDEAIASAGQGRELADGLWGKESRESQRARAVLGAALIERGRGAEAQVLLREALTPKPESFARTATPRCWALASMAKAQWRMGDSVAAEATARRMLHDCRAGRAHPAVAALARLTLASVWKGEGGGGEHALAEVAIDALERAPRGYGRFLEEAQR